MGCGIGLLYVQSVDCPSSSYGNIATKTVVVYIGKSTGATSFAGGGAVQALWSLVPVSTLESWTDVISSSFLSFRGEIVFPDESSLCVWLSVVACNILSQNLVA